MPSISWNDESCHLCGCTVVCDMPDPQSSMGWFENSDGSVAFWTPTRCIISLCDDDASVRDRIVPTVCRDNPELSGLRVGSLVGIRHQPGLWTVTRLRTEPIVDGDGAVYITGATISRSWEVDGTVRTAVLDPDVRVVTMTNPS